MVDKKIIYVGKVIISELELEFSYWFCKTLKLIGSEITCIVV